LRIPHWRTPHRGKKKKDQERRKIKKEEEERRKELTDLIFIKYEY